MSKYKFQVFTYSRDSSGYYLGASDENTVTVFADNNKEALEKAIKLRDGDKMRGTHDKWYGKVLSAEEVE